jgi:hypothetical protein
MSLATASLDTSCPPPHLHLASYVSFMQASTAGAFYEKPKDAFSVTVLL